MASGEMSAAEFLTFNLAWMKAALDHLADGGLFGAFIDWRGLPTVHAAATQLDLAPINLIVWAKANAGMGSLYRSQHELLPLFKKGDGAHLNCQFASNRDPLFAPNHDPSGVLGFGLIHVVHRRDPRPAPRVPQRWR
jgi:hypothetical protein